MSDIDMYDTIQRSSIINEDKQQDANDFASGMSSIAVGVKAK